MFGAPITLDPTETIMELHGILFQSITRHFYLRQEGDVFRCCPFVFQQDLAETTELTIFFLVGQERTR